MIIAEHKGRLGNQLFQLAGVLRLARPGEPVLLLGYEDLQKFLQTPEHVYFLNSNHRFFYRLASHAFGQVFRLPAAIRGGLLRSLEEDVSSGVIARVGGRRSLLPLTLVKETYFLADTLLDYGVFDYRRIHVCWREQAQHWFARRGLEPSGCCFVHVRRGDYCRYPSSSQPGVLPKRFFVEMMERMRAAGFSRFVVASDDWPWVLDALPEIDPEMVIMESVELTLAVMGLCGAGILSPSTYGWAAALLAGSAARPQLFLAPEHWCGFRQGAWFPYPSLRSETLTYCHWPLTSREQALRC